MWRSFLFWSLWIAATVAMLVLLAGQNLDGEGFGRVGRIALFASAGALILAEWSRLNRVNLTMEAALREAGREVPRRWEMATHGCLVIGFAMGFWALALILFSTALHKMEESGALVWVWGIATFAWTVVSLGWVSLLLGGLTRVRMRVAARGLPYPDPPTTLPWVVGAWCGPALALAFFGLPDPRIMSALVTLASAAEAPADASGAVELLVTLGPDDSILEVSSTLQAAGATVARAVPDATAAEDATLAATWVVTAPAAQAPWLAVLLELDDENVNVIELNAAVAADPVSSDGPCSQAYAALPVNDPYAVAQRELVEVNAHHLLGVLSRWPSGRPVTVAVIDTGVMGGHEDLRAVMTPLAVNDDARGHGTLVASLVGAVADNGRGVASLNLNGRYIQLLSLPALSRPNAAADDVADAIEDALDAGAGVINLSFGAPGKVPTVVDAAIARALRAGVPVVAAAGNLRAGQLAGRALDQWPANVPGVLVVGSSSAGGAGRASFSYLTDGVGLAVSAPGAQVCAASADGDYTQTSGTSMSAGTVSGLVALLRLTCPSLGPPEIARLLIASGDPMPGSGIGPRVNAAQAIVALAQQRPDCGLRTAPRGGYTPSWDGGERRVDTGD